MNNLIQIFSRNSKVLYLILLTILLSGFSFSEIEVANQQDFSNQPKSDKISTHKTEKNSADVKGEAEEMPIYGNWKSFTKQNGVPADNA